MMRRQRAWEEGLGMTLGASPQVWETWDQQWLRGHLQDKKEKNHIDGLVISDAARGARAGARAGAAVGLADLATGGALDVVAC